MPFRARFDCLWCGTPAQARAPGDLEGWSQLCPACLGRAGTNEFLRARLRAALAERGAGLAGGTGVAREAIPAVRSAAGPRPAAPASTAFPDDWFLRRGPFERGPIHDTAWAAELDVVTRWLDEQPLIGRIVEPGAGIGFFSPLLASKGELHAGDPDGSALDRARERLVAHGLLAHLHVADPWAGPGPGEAPADALLAAFLVGRVRGAGLDGALTSLRRRLRPGGRLALVDLRPDPDGGPPGGIPWTYHGIEVLEAAVARAGFAEIAVTTSGRFFLVVTATAA